MTRFNHPESRHGIPTKTSPSRPKPPKGRKPDPGPVPHHLEMKELVPEDDLPIHRDTMPDELRPDR